MAALVGQMVAQKAARKDFETAVDEKIPAVAERGSEGHYLAFVTADHCLVMQRRFPNALACPTPLSDAEPFAN